MLRSHAIYKQAPNPPSRKLLKDRVKEYWIESAKDILIDIQLRDNLEKTVVLLEDDDNERRILLKPKSSKSLEF